MSVAIALLTVLAAQTEPPQNPWIALFEMSKEMGALRLEVHELRSDLAKSLIHPCSGAAPAPVPAGPPALASLPSSLAPAPLPAKRQFGAISGRVDQAGTARTAYVYLADIKELPVRGPTAEIQQADMKFNPNHLVVQAGTRVRFPNHDIVHHHTFSLTPRDTFDLGYSRKDTPTPVRTFAVPGVIDINCNIHQFMKAAVLVVPSHHWTEVATDGSFHLKRVPPGKHTLRAWTIGAKEVEREIIVTADQDTVENLRLEAGRLPGSY